MYISQAREQVAQMHRFPPPQVKKFLLSLILPYLHGREHREENGKKNVVPADSLPKWNNQGTAREKSTVQNSVQASTWAVQTQHLNPNLLLPRLGISEKLDWKQSSRDSTRHWDGGASKTDVFICSKRLTESLLYVLPQTKYAVTQGKHWPQYRSSPIY